MKQPPLILLAEDSPANALTMQSYLEAKGDRLVVARDGEAALRLAYEHHPQLILMDIQMPQLDGIEAIKVLRQDLQFRDIPIIALTALAMEGDRERCLAAGAPDYLSKPVKLRELLQRIQQLCQCRDHPADRAVRQETNVKEGDATPNLLGGATCQEKSDDLRKQQGQTCTTNQPANGAQSLAP